MSYLILLLFLLGWNQISAQEIQSAKNRKFDLNFKKQNTFWNWQSDFKYNDDFYGDSGYQISDNFVTNLNIDSKGKKYWKDQNRFSGFFYKNISDFQTGIYAESWVLSDELSSTTNQVSNHILGIKTNYSPSSYLIVTPYAGYQRDEQVERVNWGWDLGLEGKYNNFKLDNYYGDLSFNLDYDIYKLRRNSINGVEIKLGTRFSAVAVDSLRASYGYENKQSLLADDNLRTTIIEKKNIHNVLGYKLSRNSDLVIHTSLISTNTDDNISRIPQRDKLEFKNRFNYFYYLPKLILNFGFDAFQAVEDNTNIDSDSKELQSNFRTNIQYSLSPSDILNFNFYLGKYQYDTPDTSNHDDRDQLSIVASLKYMKEFSRVLSFAIEANTDLVHQVYIFKENSANNNWNRIYKLSSDVTYRYKEFRNTLKNEILANYTSYDFEELLSISQSFLLRKYTLEDSLIFPIFPKLFTGVNGRLELDDKGNFIKDEFAQKIIQSSMTSNIDIFFRFTNIYLLNFDTGIAYYQRKDWNHIPDKNLIRDTKEITPYLRIRYRVIDKIRFMASAAYTFRDEMSKERLTFTTGSLSLIKYF